MKRQAVRPAAGDQVHIDVSSVPAYAATNLAQVLFTVIHRDFEDPAVQADYQRWKAEREAAR